MASTPLGDVNEVGRPRYRGVSGSAQEKSSSSAKWWPSEFMVCVDRAARPVAEDPGGLLPQGVARIPIPGRPAGPRKIVGRYRQRIDTPSRLGRERSADIGWVPAHEVVPRAGSGVDRGDETELLGEAQGQCRGRFS